MERILDREERAYKNMVAVAAMLEATSVKGFHYYVNECYFDMGQNWMWTTILCRDKSLKPDDVLASWQELSPRQWKAIEAATSVADLTAIVEDIQAGDYFMDK